MPCPLGPSKGRDDDDCCWNIARKLKVDLCGERLSTDKHGRSHRDTAEQHHGHGLVIAADDHPGAMEERHAVTRQFLTKHGSRRRKGAGQRLIRALESHQIAEQSEQ